MRLIPSTFDEHPNASPGERDIFSALKNSKIPNNWIVIHSLELMQHVTKSQSEADFIFFIPNVGVLVLEVKSVKKLALKDGTWTLGQKKETRGPFKQANDAMWSVLDYLDERSIDYRSVPFVHGVWFTHLTREQIETSISWKANQYLASEDLEAEITRTILEMTTSLIADLKITFPKPIAPLSTLNQISETLLPRFTAYQKPADRKKDVAEFLAKALKEQLELIKLVKPLRAVILDGLAGTGKTYIALQRAKLAHEDGKTVLFVCYNRLLARKLQDELKNFPRIRVTSLHALMLEVADIEQPSEPSKEWWNEILVETALVKAQEFASRNKFNFLVVDEAQDLGTMDYLFFLDNVIEGGLAHCQMFITGDFQHQGVYSSGKKAKENFISSIPGSSELEPITTNCRNTRNLGEFMVEMLELSPNYDAYRRIDNDGEVTPRPYSSETEIPQKLMGDLKELVKKFSEKEIIILSKQKTKLGNLLARLKMNFTELKSSAVSGIRWGGVNEFKGLEGMAIVLIEFEEPNEYLRESFYVGATRAIQDLVYFVPEAKVGLLGITEADKNE